MKIEKLLISLFFLSSFSSFSQSDSLSLTIRIEKTILLISKDSESFSKENLKKFIKEMKINNPKIVYAQAYHETNGFKSKVFKSNNNLFGMKVPRTRPTTAINQNDKKGYAKYKHWKESVLDYYYYQQYRNIELSSEKEYLVFLRKNYATDKKYIQKILKFAE